MGAWRSVACGAPQGKAKPRMAGRGQPKFGLGASPLGFMLVFGCRETMQRLEHLEKRHTGGVAPVGVMVMVKKMIEMDGDDGDDAAMMMSLMLEGGGIDESECAS